MAEGSKLVQIRLTNEKIEAMKAYFLLYDWDFSPENVKTQCGENS